MTTEMADSTSPSSAHDLNFEPLTCCGIYGRVFSVFCRQGSLLDFIGMACVATVPYALVGVPLSHVFLDWGEELQEDAFGMDGPITSMGVSVKYYGAIFCTSILHAVFYTLLAVIGHAGMIRTVVDVYLGTGPDLNTNLQHGVRKFGTLFCSGLLVALCSILFVIPLVVLNGLADVSGTPM